MSMRAVSNVDTILVIKDGIRDKTVATFHPEDNLLEMHGGCARFLTDTLAALRKYQKERNQPVLPVKVEYW